MDSVQIALLITSIFFALNIGGSGMAPAFGVAMGAGLVSRRIAVALFTVFVIAGALLLGKFVAKTLGSGLVSADTFTPATALCVLLAATTALLIANLLRIPQSTSWVTVFAIATVGLTRGSLNTDTILFRLAPAWLGLPLVSFVATFGLTRLFYPARAANFRALERLGQHRRTLRALVAVTSCYVAMAIGANNVANVVGPLAAAGVVEVVGGFLLVAPLCGLGGLVFRAPAETMGRDIVPLGLVSATIINLVAGSVLLTASWLGIPQSLVHINAAAVAAVSFAKEGSWELMQRDLLQRIGALWVVTPLIAAALTVGLLRMVG